MAFDPTLAAVRFGTGLAPGGVLPASVDVMLSQLSGPDLAAQRWPVPLYEDARPTRAEIRDVNRTRRDTRGTPDEAAGEEAYQAQRQEVEVTKWRGLAAVAARNVGTEDGLRERLVLFWANHFTVRGKNVAGEHLVTPFVESAIRPRITGRFANMLRAVILNPEMLIYLDQTRSMGPNSEAAQRRDRGLNENLARELLELHTVGVGGPYTQTDVREMAELLTGLGWTVDRGMHYRRDHAEPGSETVLGVTYPDDASLRVIETALEGLANHPATAAHVAHKMAVHFVSDTPDDSLVEAMTARFIETEGNLLSVTRAMLEHPAAWGPELAKAKPPFGFLTSALRALGADPDAIAALDRRDTRRFLGNPLALMGQPWEDPGGPDGWPEAAEEWIAPQGLAARISWAMRMPRQIVDPLPDPRDFVGTALGPLAGEVTVFAAGAAESRHEGVGVVLASADFNRR
jgi:uncharacterized protein (DUF1800 family)